MTKIYTFLTAHLCGTLLVGAASLVLTPLTIWACSIPVFQYALVSWPADPYGVIVFHRGPLSPEEQAMIASDGVTDIPARRANVIFRTVDLAESLDEAMRELWEAQTDAELPWMVVRYPRFLGIQDDVWSGRFTAAAVEALLDSPVRREIARRILEGESAVWVLLESGVQQEDEAAARLLETQLKKMEEALEIWVPGGDTFADTTDAGQTEPSVPQVVFSMVRLSRNDPAERMFVQMLLRSEWDLKAMSKPMAFPIFGRGRILYALVGDGINEDNIEMSCSFLVGWCSCEVKALNPGLDLLMSVNWDDMIPMLDAGYWPLDENNGSQVIGPDWAEGNSAGAEGSSHTLKRNILIVVLIQILGAAIVSCVVLWRRKRNSVISNQ